MHEFEISRVDNINLPLASITLWSPILTATTSVYKSSKIIFMNRS